MSGQGTAEKRPRTASREVRRRQLIEATIEAIAQHGLSGTTMAEVTGRADLSLGLVAFHFQSKENLLQETLVYLAEEHRNRWVENLAAAGPEPAARLAAVMDAHFDPRTCDETRVRVWFAFFGESKYRKVYRDKISRFDTERSGVVTDLCREITENGYPDVSAEDVARNLESLADGLWLSIMLYPDWMNRAGAKRQVHSYLSAVFPREFAIWPGTVEAPTPQHSCSEVRT